MQKGQRMEEDEDDEEDDDDKEDEEDKEEADEVEDEEGDVVAWTEAGGNALLASDKALDEVFHKFLGCVKRRLEERSEAVGST